MGRLWKKAPEADWWHQSYTTREHLVISPAGTEGCPAKTLHNFSNEKEKSSTRTSRKRSNCCSKSLARLETRKLENRTVSHHVRLIMSKRIIYIHLYHSSDEFFWLRFRIPWVDLFTLLALSSWLRQLQLPLSLHAQPPRRGALCVSQDWSIVLRGSSAASSCKSGHSHLHGKHVCKEFVSTAANNGRSHEVGTHRRNMIEECWLP